MLYQTAAGPRKGPTSGRPVNRWPAPCPPVGCGRFGVPDRGFPMCSIRRTFAASLLLALAACGGKHNTNDGFDGGSSSYALTLVGSANYVLHPTDKRTLQVLLSQDQVGPVANASIHFEFQDGETAGAKLDVQDVETDANGAATVHFTAGTAAGRPTFKVVASAPNYGPDPVAFSFNVIPIRTLLQIIGTPTTHVSADGSSGTTLIGANSSVALKVRELDLDTGAPIAKDNITFTLPPAAGNVKVMLSLAMRSEEHTSELQSRFDIVCRL